MKKYGWLVLAILLALLAVALPASAKDRKDRSRNSNHSDGRRDHRNDGHRGGNRIVIPIPQIVVSPLYDPYYDPYYGVGYRRNGVNRVLHSIFAPEPIYAYGERPQGYYEEQALKNLAKCHKNVAKDYAKRNVTLTIEQIDAICHGQPLSDLTPPAPENRTQDLTNWSLEGNSVSPERSQTPAVPSPPVVSSPPVATPHVWLGVFAKNGQLHNDDPRIATILVDGKIAGTLAPGGTISVSELPKGRLEYQY